VREEPPRWPRRLRADLPPDLEAVLLTALEKEPARRYGSVEAFAADLRRHLRDEPVEARPPSVTHQVRLFARRHRPLVVSAAAVVVVAIAAAAVSLGFALRSRDAERRAVEERDRAVVERRRAETLFETVLRRSLSTTGQHAPLLHEMPGGAEAARRLVDATVADLRVLDGIAGADPRVREALADAHVRLGDVQGNPFVSSLRDVEGAERSYAEALRYAEQALASAPSRGARLLRARALRKLAEVEGLRPGPGAARDRLDAAHREVAAIRAAYGADAELLGEEALLHLTSGLSRVSEQRFDEALSHAERLAAAIEPLPPEDPEVRSLRANGSALRGRALLYLDRPGEARLAYEDALHLLDAEAAGDRGTYSERLRRAALRNAHALSCARAGAPEEAGASWERAASLLADLCREDPDDYRAVIELTDVSMHLGELRRAQALGSADPAARRARLESAMANYRGAIETLSSPDPPPSGSHRAAIVADLEARLEALRSEAD
jgi:tetratricopeptide (TPR) repeat protein